MVMTDLRDTLLVLATVENGPSNATGVLALKEERLGLAVLEAEDLGVPADVDLTLQHRKKMILARPNYIVKCRSFCAQRITGSWRSWKTVPKARVYVILSVVVVEVVECR